MPGINGTYWWDIPKFQTWRMPESSCFVSDAETLIYFIVSPDGNQCALIHQERVVLVTETSDAYQRHLARLAGSDDDDCDDEEEYANETSHGIDPTAPNIWISPDGSRVALGYNSYGRGTIFLDNEEHDVEGSLHDVWFSPDSKHCLQMIGSCDDGFAYLVDGVRHSGMVVSGEYTRDSAHLVILLERDSRNILLVDGRKIIEFKEPQTWRKEGGSEMDLDIDGANAESFTFSPDSRFMLFGYIGSALDADNDVPCIGVYSFERRRTIKTFSHLRIHHVRKKASEGMAFDVLVSNERERTPHPCLMHIIPELGD